MSLGHGPPIVTGGLVFYYDVANVQKSSKGGPATNLFTETNLINWTKSAGIIQSLFTTPFNNSSYSVTELFLSSSFCVVKASRSNSIEKRIVLSNGLRCSMGTK